ncbi:MAG: hypothetical protein WCG08_16550 [Paludibacter sp.]|jgi:hypothetical protein
MKTISVLPKRFFKSLFILMLFFSNGHAIYSQSYKSVFASDTTRWNVFQLSIEMGWTNAYYCTSDTITINEKLYKVLYKDILHNQSQKLAPNKDNIIGYLREDSINGKLWLYRNAKDISNPEILVMNMSLKVGDSIPIINSISSDSFIYNKVTAIYYENNRKIIELDREHFNWFSATYEKIKFIEGIGTNYGFENPYSFLLLCKYGNGKSIFSSANNCYFEGTWGEVKNPSFQDIRILKNDTENKMTIYSSTENDLKIQVIDNTGRIVDNFNVVGNVCSHSISKYSKGIYLIKICDLKTNDYIVRKLIL